MPGVLMVEALVQTARRLGAGNWGPLGPRRGQSGPLRGIGPAGHGAPDLHHREKTGPDGIECKGEGFRDDGQTAVSGRFIMRPLRPAQSGPQTLNTGVEQ